MKVKDILSWGDVTFFLGFWAFIAVRAHWGVRAWAGCALAAAGFALWMTARLQLGRSFSLRAKAVKLVTTGLYAKFRHPVYLFGFAAYCGVLLMWGNWIAVVCFLLIYSVELARLRGEERVLERTFGDEYRRYRAGTWL